MGEEIRWEETMLESLAESVAYPATPDLRAAVLARVAAAPRTAASPVVGRIATAAVAVVLVAALVVVFSHDARDAIADFLGLAVEGERIEVLPSPAVGTTATPVPTPFTPIVVLETIAQPITRADAETRLGKPPILPASLGEPRAFYALRDIAPVVVMDYGQVQIWELPYEGEYFVLKGIVGGGTVVQEVRVNNAAGYWVSGGSRIVTINDTNGPRSGTQRTVTANALLWASGGMYRRIEGAGTLEEALKLAVQMR